MIALGETERDVIGFTVAQEVMLFTVVLVSDDVLGDANDGARVESRRDLCLKLD